MIYIFHLHSTIRRKYMVLFHVIFDLCTTMHDLINLFLLCARNHSTKNWGPHRFIYIYLHTTIRPNYIVLFHLFFLWCTTIRSKIRVLINLYLILVHDHSTKVRGCSYSLIYDFLSCPHISFAIFMADTALRIFRALCFI